MNASRAPEGGSLRLGLIGCGVQAHAVLRAHASVMEITEVRLADVRPEAAEAVAAACPDLPCLVVDLARAAACDVVCTMTPSRAPLVSADMLGPTVHINAVSKLEFNGLAGPTSPAASLDEAKPITHAHGSDIPE